jgi:hypothetical protein
MIDAKEELSEAIWAALFIPLFLIATLGFLPLSIIGFGVFIDQPTDRRVYIALAAAVVVVAMLLYANRKDLRRYIATRRSK